MVGLRRTQSSWFVELLPRNIPLLCPCPWPSKVRRVLRRHTTVVREGFVLELSQISMWSSECFPSICPDLFSFELMSLISQHIFWLSHLRPFLRCYRWLAKRETVCSVQVSVTLFICFTSVVRGTCRVLLPHKISQPSGLGILYQHCCHWTSWHCSYTANAGLEFIKMVLVYFLPMQNKTSVGSNVMTPG